MSVHLPASRRAHNRWTRLKILCKNPGVPSTLGSAETEASEIRSVFGRKHRAIRCSPHRRSPPLVCHRPRQHRGNYHTAKGRCKPQSSEGPNSRNIVRSATFPGVRATATRCYIPRLGLSRESPTATPGRARQLAGPACHLGRDRPPRSSARRSSASARVSRQLV